MARHEKGKKTALLLQDKFFYTLLTVTMVLLIVAFYFAFGDSPTETPPLTATEGELEGQGENIVSKPVIEPDNVASLPEGTLPQSSENTEIPVTAPAEEVTDTETSSEATLPPAEEEAPVENRVYDFAVPCDGTVLNGFSGTVPVFSATLLDWRIHSGIDIVTDGEKNVFAVEDGVVEDVYNDGLMGTSILIKHGDGVYSLYQGLTENTRVLNRMEVFKGDIIGKTGATAAAEEAEGTHLHFEMIVDGKNADPAEYIDFS